MAKDYINDVNYPLNYTSHICLYVHVDGQESACTT